MPLPKPLPMSLLKESLEVDPTCPSGLRWKDRPRGHFISSASWKRQNTKYARKPAGCLDTASNRFWVLLAPLHLQASRIVWALSNDCDPGHFFVDHKDGDTTNNRIDNLRLSTHSENSRNKPISSRNKSGCVGVGWNKRKNRWAAEINVNNKRIRLGLYKDYNEAVAARRKAEPKHHGEFAGSLREESGFFPANQLFAEFCCA